MARSPDPDRVPWLTPRQREVVRLVGGWGLSYKRAAAQLPHRHVEGVTISPRSVAQYAQQIRDAMDSPLRPRDALHALYRERPEDFD